MIPQEILNTFIQETENGKYTVMDPLAFDKTISGGPFETRELAESALINYVNVNDVSFE